MKPAKPPTPGKPAALGVANYRADPLFPRIERAVTSILAKGRVVAPVDVLIAMQLLSPDRLEDWRRGRVQYLERVISSNLSRSSRLLRILQLYADDLKLKPSQTVYCRHGKRPKQPLRFTKTGDANLEAAYSRHFVRLGKPPVPPLSANAAAAAPAGDNVELLPHQP